RLFLLSPFSLWERGNERVARIKQSLAAKTLPMLNFRPMVNKPGVTTAELGTAVRRRREQQGLSLRDVADLTGVSASTLSRIENGTGKPDADNIARLTNWLDVPMERILGGRQVDSQESKPVIYFPQEATPDIVEAHLRADRNLTEETAKALSE